MGSMSQVPVFSKQGGSDLLALAEQHTTTRQRQKLLKDLFKMLTVYRRVSFDVFTLSDVEKDRLEHSSDGIR